MSAFTTVTSARRALGGPTGYIPPPPMTHHLPPPPPMHIPPPPPPLPKKPTVFPEAVRQYVQRSFDTSNRIDGVTAEEMQTRLKDIINQVSTAGNLESTDWSSMPLPQTLIIQEKQAASNIPSARAQDLLSHLNIANGVVPPTNKANSKKRKSHEMGGQHSDIQMEEAIPPWHTKMTTRNVFEDRVTFPTPAESQQLSKAEKKQRKLNEKLQALDSSRTPTELEKRRQRFNLDSPRDISPIRTTTRSFSPPPIQGPVIGTCQTLEKRYFRLTSAPKPETVRPLPVLEKALDFLKKKWKSEYNYAYICDQFKSMRQDLTVQHIKNSFTVNVYETHAHIALQKGDLGEYNQCQTQLRALYKQKLGGRPAEFLAYRILYFIYTGNRTDMNDLLANVTPADRQVPAVKHALDVRSALALGNYHRFFRLYLNAPNMGPYLMDMFIARERLSALAYISRAYKPEVPLRFLTEELAFENDPDCAGFICDNGGEALLEGKPDGPVFLSGKAGPTFEAARAAAFRRVDLKGQI